MKRQKEEKWSGSKEVFGGLGHNHGVETNYLYVIKTLDYYYKYKVINYNN